MTTDTDTTRFFRTYGATAVGPTPPQPSIPADGDENEHGTEPPVTLDVECDLTAWAARTVPEAPAEEGEFPERFVDGSQSGQPVVCVRAPAGWPIPFYLAEVGAVALKSAGRHFEREYVAVERVLSFVADPFPWEQVEALAADLMNRPEFRLRVLPANSPREPHNPFDYEVMRAQARARAQEEMTNLERLALAIVWNRPTLVDGPLDRVTGEPRSGEPLLIGVVKSQSSSYFSGFDSGWRVLLNLGPIQRTPVFKIADSTGLRVR
jgi:hypothetical protein